MELEERILKKVGERLGPGRLQGAIVYLDRELKRAGEAVQSGDVVIDLPWDCHIAFVDLEPRANWGHACAYLAIRADGDDAIEIAARMPPFLKAGSSGFRLLWRGPLAPEWAVAASPL